MAKRKEIEVGQVRELKDPSSGRYASLAVAKVKVLAVDQTAEVYSPSNDRSGGRYNLHEDMVLVEVLDANGWHFDSTSARQDKVRPLLGQKNTGNQSGMLSWARRWKTEDLPEGRYLVKAALLGPLWDQDAKDEARRREDEAEAKRARHGQAVAAQRKEIKALAEEAGIETRWSRFDSGNSVQLTWNELADLILLASSSPGQIDVGRVEWSDYA